MSQPPVELRGFIDIGNDGLTPSPATLVTGTLPTTKGTRGVATIRTATTTISLFLTAEDCKVWGEILLDLGKTLEGKSRLITPTMMIPPGLLGGKP